jgi:hypothetical protein
LSFNACEQGIDDDTAVNDLEAHFELLNGASETTKESFCNARAATGIA